MRRKQANTVRIIGGQWRGRRLPVVNQSGLRPTTDRVRETLFNWLTSYLSGANCLDLFAGTGVLGLECLSRGAGQLVAVESAKSVVSQLSENVKLLEGGASSVTHVVERDALQFLKAPSRFEPFDLVFVDPPFQLELQVSVCALLEQNGWLADGAMIYVEQDFMAEVTIPENWKQYRQGRAGQSNFTLYQRESVT